MQEVKTQPSWQEEYKNAYRTVESLLADGFLSPSHAEALKPVADRYQILVTPYYASLIDKYDGNCPIRRQALPSIEELEIRSDLSPDPLLDLKYQPVPKVTHRYQNRALLHLTTNCSMYCRYCFRKSLLNELKEEFITGDLESAFTYIKDHTEIEEVILSGGDPLLVSDGNLLSVLNTLSNFSHIKRLRIHTRVPVTCPHRITPGLIEALRSIKKPLTFVLHYNHPKEITLEARNAVQLLKKVSAQVLNQSVLLKGVNDDVQTLKTLSEKLFEAGVLPYYLHHPDPAQGTAGFQIAKESGVEIFKKLKELLPGYLVPRYVEDKPASAYKCSLA